MYTQTLSLSLSLATTRINSLLRTIEFVVLSRRNNTHRQYISIIWYYIILRTNETNTKHTHTLLTTNQPPPPLVNIIDHFYPLFNEYFVSQKGCNDETTTRTTATTIIDNNSFPYGGSPIIRIRDATAASTGKSKMHVERTVLVKSSSSTHLWLPGKHVWKFIIEISRYWREYILFKSIIVWQMTTIPFHLITW